MAATFTDDILKSIILNENIIIKCSPKFVSRGSIENIPE